MRADAFSDIEASLIVPVKDSRTSALAHGLEHDSLRIAIETADVLRSPARAIVYVFFMEAAHAIAFANRIVGWASGAGLIGLVGNGDTHEREALLAAGFDDVVIGEIGMRELSARIRAVHRRLHWHDARPGWLRFGGFTLDLHDHLLLVDGRRISLTAIELAVMRALVKARGQPLSRATLLDEAWGYTQVDITERAVDNVILRLRRKLPDPDAIETVRSVGFRLVG